MHDKHDYFKKLDQARNAAKLEAFHNRHKGERCFVIGNGPSLLKTDLTLLKNENTFGMNKIYLNFPRMGYCPTYLAAINPLVLEQSAKEIAELPCPKFIGHEGLKFLPLQDDLMYFFCYSEEPRFAASLLENLWQGHTVTFCVMQIAYYMGFEELILLGVDHSFKMTGKPNQEVVSEGDDSNHFDPNYFGKGVKWHLPDLEMSEKAYCMAKAAFEKRGGRILDGTIGGQLDVFEKVDYESLV